MRFQAMSDTVLRSRRDRRLGDVHVLKLTLTLESDDRDLLYTISEPLGDFCHDQATLMLRERGASERDAVLTLSDQQTIEFERDR